MKNVDKKLLIDCVEQAISWEENMDRAFTLKKLKVYLMKAFIKKYRQIIILN